MKNITLFLTSSGLVWACVELPARDVAWRAESGTTDAPEPSEPNVPSDPPGDLGGGTEDPNEQIPPPDEEGCPAIFAQDILPTFELTIAPEVWTQLQWEWEHGVELVDKGLDPRPYHPLTEFRHGEIVIGDAEIRLRGNPAFWNIDDKYQFQITFDRVDKKGHFLGLDALLLEAATFNRHMLRDRLALSIMRDMGVDAPCANNARLVINGQYYGIFTNLEKVDKLFLQRTFDDPSGDLWKREDWQLQTNKKTANTDRLDALNAAQSIEELETHLDVEQALTVYAAEAILPNSDGAWAGGLNFYLYDDPLGGTFKLIPWDLDNTFERFDDGENGDYPNNPDPVVWEKKATQGRPWYDLALANPDWFWYYIECLTVQFEAAYDVAILHERIDTWTEQIKQSVLDDINKPYSNKTYLKKVDELKNYVEARHEWMVEWLACWKSGGQPDNEGYCS